MIFDDVREEFAAALNAELTGLREDFFSAVDTLMSEWEPIGGPKKATVRFGNKKLDPAMGQVLKRHLQNNGTLLQFFEVNADLLGARNDYDLSEFSGFLSDLDQRQIDRQIEDWQRPAATSGGKLRMDDGWGGTLKRHLLSGGTLAEFFEANADLLGKMEDYDLSEFSAPRR